MFPYNKLVDQGGPIIQKAVVQPIFWGPEWNSASAALSANNLVSDLKQLFAGPYMLGLSQYNGISPASILNPVFDLLSKPPQPITLPALGDYVKTLLAASKVPDFRADDQLLYFIVTSGHDFSQANVDGYHYFDQFDGKTFHYAWAEDPSTTTASHEIIEACTDPEGNGFIQPENGIEAADICEDNADWAGLSDGIQASSYWSNIDGDCILPQRVARITVTMGTYDECKIGPIVGNQATLSVSVGIDPNWINPFDVPLVNPQYSWSFNPYVAQAVGPTDGPTLVLNWIAGGGPEASVVVTVTAQTGVKLEAFVSFLVRTKAQASLLARLCSLRKFLNSVAEVAPPIINPLGPDRRTTSDRT